MDDSNFDMGNCSSSLNVKLLWRRILDRILASIKFFYSSKNFDE